MSKWSRLLAALALASALSGCGINPVTGKQEIQLISTSQEVAIGEQNYQPSRQAHCRRKSLVASA